MHVMYHMYVVHIIHMTSHMYVSYVCMVHVYSTSTLLYVKLHVHTCYLMVHTMGSTRKSVILGDGRIDQNNTVHMHT